MGICQRTNNDRTINDDRITKLSGEDAEFGGKNKNTESITD